MKEHQNSAPKTGRGPKSKLGKILLNLVVTLVLGAIYFYVSLPALNFQSSDLYVFVGFLCIVYIICAFITSGFHLEEGKTTTASGGVITIQGGKIK